MFSLERFTTLSFTPSQISRGAGETSRGEKNTFSPNDPIFPKKRQKLKKRYLSLCRLYFFKRSTVNGSLYFVDQSNVLFFFNFELSLLFYLELSIPYLKKVVGVPTLPSQTLLSRRYFFKCRSVIGTIKIDVESMRLGVSQLSLTTRTPLKVTSNFLKRSL